MKTKMVQNLKKLTLMCMVLMITASVAISQSAPKKYKLGKLKCKLITISDPGELYSTFELSDDDISDIKNHKVNETLMADIIEKHTEDAWPSKLKNLDDRVDNPDIMKDYHAYKVCKFGQRYVLIIPSKYNDGQPEGWAPDEDIFLIIGEEGVTE